MIRWIEDEQAQGDLAEIYRAYKAANPHRDEMPGILKCFSLRPDFLKQVIDHLRDHLNSTGSVQLGSWWLALVGVVTPIALVYVLIDELRAVLDEPYGGYPDWLINSIGWGSAALVVVVALVLARLPWRRTVDLSAPSQEVSR